MQHPCLYSINSHPLGENLVHSSNRKNTVLPYDKEVVADKSAPSWSFQKRGAESANSTSPKKDLTYRCMALCMFRGTCCRPETTVTVASSFKQVMAFLVIQQKITHLPEKFRKCLGCSCSWMIPGISLVQAGLGGVHKNWPFLLKWV